ncbi:MAG: class I SAM-dependent methyltransferase, partial [Planctomycetales bacterium]|nr:class I SAM-dependent methyltransferase [Planctomycetales bacterium]
MLCLTNTSSVVLPENEPAAKVWNSGGANYDRISRQIADAIEHCVDRLNPQAGENVLDVATGTGWTARRIAARGANVTGVDICSTALETARSIDNSRQINFQVGDAEALQFDDATFDAIASTFGVMFCGAPERAASELARVCKPGGR